MTLDGESRMRVRRKLIKSRRLPCRIKYGFMVIENKYPCSFVDMEKVDKFVAEALDRVKS